MITPEAMSPAQEAWFDYRKDYGSWHEPELAQAHKHFVAGFEFAQSEGLPFIAAQAKAVAWDEGFSAGWAEAKDPGAFVNDVWDAETPNPYNAANIEGEANERD